VWDHNILLQRATCKAFESRTTFIVSPNRAGSLMAELGSYFSGEVLEGLLSVALLSPACCMSFLPVIKLGNQDQARLTAGRISLYLLLGTINFISSSFEEA
jgi:hypothetical protein